jgi:ABC-type branched-subunit amino acid transport system permease subunit
MAAALRADIYQRFMADRLAQADVDIVLGQRPLGSGDAAAIVPAVNGVFHAAVQAVARPGLTREALVAEPLRRVATLSSFPYVIEVQLSNPYTFRQVTIDNVTAIAAAVGVVALGIAVLVAAALYFANESRTGRAWRALREDPLAAEVMTVPVNRLKLLAFAFGAGIAGFTGAIYGSVQTGAFPGDYDIGLLITIYAVVILGGTGSIAGVALGAIVINCVPELLRSQQNASWLFYGLILIVIVTRVRPWHRCVALLGGLLAFGFAVHALADASYPRLTAARPRGGGFLKGPLESWVLQPTHPVKIADFAYVILIAAILLVTRLDGWRRLVALVPTLYLAAVVWENLLIQQTAGATRLILLGALLVGLMNARPQGLLGTPRVEII